MDMKYKVIITPTAFKEINEIYDYILEVLYAEKAAKDLIMYYGGINYLDGGLL